MNRATKPVVLEAFLALLVFFSSLALAPARPDFSGSYAEKPGKAGEPASAGVALRVVQTDSYIEVTRTQSDGTFTNRFPLDGTEGEYTTVTGVRGKCKARFSKGLLVLDASVTSKRSDGSTRRLEPREEWRLSKDLKTLTIKIDLRMPDMPPEIVAMAFPNNPRTEIYERTAER